MEAVRGWLETGLAQRFNGRRIAICGFRLTTGSSMLGPSSKRRCRGAISTTGRCGPATNFRPTVTPTKLSFTRAIEIRHFVVPHGAIFHSHAGSTRVVDPVIKTQDGVWIKRIAYGPHRSSRLPSLVHLKAFDLPNQSEWKQCCRSYLRAVPYRYQ